MKCRTNDVKDKWSVGQMMFSSLCRTNGKVPCTANYPANQITYFLHIFTNFCSFCEFLEISTNFYAFLQISATFTNFSKVLYFPAFLTRNFYKFLHIPTNLNDNSYTFVLLAETNMKTCLHAVLSTID